jgi:hypothetical protein
MSASTARPADSSLCSSPLTDIIAAWAAFTFALTPCAVVARSVVTRSSVSYQRANNALRVLVLFLVVIAAVVWVGSPHILLGIQEFPAGGQQLRVRVRIGGRRQRPFQHPHGIPNGGNGGIFVVFEIFVSTRWPDIQRDLELQQNTRKRRDRSKAS